MEKNCIVCSKPFNAQRDSAKFCSPACRKAYSRQVTDDPITEPIETEPTNDEWYNSAETKTQAEIESHYTLANFPCKARYYGNSGSGTGSLSPYRMTDPRYQAYTL